MKSRVLSVFGAVVVALGVALGSSTLTAHASVAAPAVHAATAAKAAPANLIGWQEEICNTDTYEETPIAPCLNDYTGSSNLIKAYLPGYSDEALQEQNYSGSNWQIYDPYTGGCVGDYGNSSSDAKAAGLGSGSCPSGGNAGWGTIFTKVSSCSGYADTLRNSHWAGDLDVAVADGSQAYLNNSSTSHCWNQFTS